MKYIVRAIILFLVISPLAFGADTAEEKLCENMCGIERTTCLESENAKAEAELKAAINEANKSIEAEEEIPPGEKQGYKDAIKNSQENWQKYVSAECGNVILFSNWGASGSFLSNASLSCKVAKTKLRILELRDRN